MAGFTALVSKHLYLGMIVSCHFDIILVFLDQVRCSWHNKSTVPHCNTQPSINHPLPAQISLPEPAAMDKAAHPCHCSFCHWGAPGPHDSPANDTTVLCKLGIWCQRGGSWAGRCWATSKRGHCFKWCMSGPWGLFLRRWRWLSLKEQTEGDTQKCTSLSPGRSQGLPGDQYRFSAHSWLFSITPTSGLALSLPSQRMGQLFLPTSVLAGLTDPQVLWREGKLQVMLLAGQQVR